MFPSDTHQINISINKMMRESYLENNSKTPRLPSIFLITIIVGLPMFSETIYMPSLPSIALMLNTKQEFVEYTLTSYLAGFGFGSLFFGIISDSIGRKPSVLIGFFIYLIGCLLCIFSNDINALIISRFVQGFGGSVGSVIGQAICRDAFTGPNRAAIFSAIGAGLSFFPAIGPVIGGAVSTYLGGWKSNFVLLLFLGIIVIALNYFTLPETHEKSKRHKIKSNLVNLFPLIKQIITDKKVLSYGFLIAALNGIQFSYYAEGSFCLVEILNLSPVLYGASFFILAIFSAVGNYISKKLNSLYHTKTIIFIGIFILLFVNLFFSLSSIYFSEQKQAMIFIIIFSMSINMLGFGMTIPNCLSNALNEYRNMIGSASSLFGLFYYSITSLFTLFMGVLHNGSIIVMPIYFFTISLSMVFVLLLKNI